MGLPGWVFPRHIAIKERSNVLQEQEEEYMRGEELLEYPPCPYSPCFFGFDSDEDQHMQNDIIDNSFESDEEFGLGMMFDKALNDPPCVTIIHVS